MPPKQSNHTISLPFLKKNSEFPICSFACFHSEPAAADSAQCPGAPDTAAAENPRALEGTDFSRGRAATHLISNWAAFTIQSLVRLKALMLWHFYFLVLLSPSTCSVDSNDIFSSNSLINADTGQSAAPFGADILLSCLPEKGFWNSLHIQPYTFWQVMSVL